MTKLAYFCAKVKNGKTKPDKAIVYAQKQGYKLFIPAVELSNHQYPKDALLCKKAIKESDLIICQPPIGNDCSWELGYAVGLGKKIVCLDKLPKDDWMTKIGVEYV